MSNMWFTSDQHFDHANIINICNRPFASLEEMQSQMIDRFNSVVKDNDTVFFLGDFSFVDPTPYLKLLKGKKKFVRGNHDHKHNLWPEESLLGSYAKLNVNHQKIIMCHYPIYDWDGKFKGSWHLYGHIHNNYVIKNGQCMNVGVDVNNFYPFSYDDVVVRMRSLQSQE